MLQAGGRGEERVEEVAQHQLVRLHLVALEPPGKQPGLLEEGGIDHVGDVVATGEHSPTLSGIGEVDGVELDAG